jgi:hypothetical protein
MWLGRVLGGRSFEVGISTLCGLSCAYGFLGLRAFGMPDIKDLFTSCMIDLIVRRKFLRSTELSY